MNNMENEKEFCKVCGGGMEIIVSHNQVMYQKEIHCVCPKDVSSEDTCKPAKYVWMVVGSGSPCDIRRYAFSHKEAVSQLKHQAKTRRYKDCFYKNGVWALFKLVQVDKRREPK